VRGAVAGRSGSYIACGRRSKIECARIHRRKSRKDTQETNDAKFDLIVFDWDGTLLDSACSHRAFDPACLSTISDLRSPTMPRPVHVIGLGLVDALAPRGTGPAFGGIRSWPAAIAITICRAIMNWCCSMA
jgi:hypothetical protein